jgi:hypothetical protein
MPVTKITKQGVLVGLAADGGEAGEFVLLEGNAPGPEILNLGDDVARGEARARERPIFHSGNESRWTSANSPQTQRTVDPVLTAYRSSLCSGRTSFVRRATTLGCWQFAGLSSKPGMGRARPFVAE